MATRSRKETPRESQRRLDGKAAREKDRALAVAVCNESSWGALRLIQQALCVATADGLWHRVRMLDDARRALVACGGDFEGDVETTDHG